MNDFLDRMDQALTFKRLFSLLLTVLLFFSLISVPTAAAEEVDDKPIIVSMGDSYSAGEGIEKFYDQDKHTWNGEHTQDWLAHRSEKSWPGLLEFPGLDKQAKYYKDSNWFFVAASGAETVHFGELDENGKIIPGTGTQSKAYDHGLIDRHTDPNASLPPQLSIFETLPANSVDYVTLTIGGNDANFSGIVTEAVMKSTYLNTSNLTDMLSDIWAKYYKSGGIRDDIYASYKKIEKKAGPQARIIVAGYPKLLEPHGIGLPFSYQEALEINRAVSNFNIEIKRIVTQCANEDMNIHFVSVEEAFSGHEVWSFNPYLNPIKPAIGTQDLNAWHGEFTKWIASSYSVHPNDKGAEKYADCVNTMIKQITEEEAKQMEQEALNPAPKDREVVLVLDQSGSMAGEPMRETIQAAKQFASSAVAMDANVGVVAYDDKATVISAITGSETYLHKRIGEIRSGGGTNIEAGLKMADQMLEDSTAKKKIIVLMSDGVPNEGKTGQELVDYANELKDEGYYIYTLGFFSALNNKEAAQQLMDDIAGEGNHYEVENAEDLKFFFGDIAEQVTGTKYIYVRIACPVDVTVEYNGEKMSSKGSESSVRTSFGTMTFEENVEDEDEDDDDDKSSKNDDRIKVLRLKEGAEYTIEIEGNGKGTMDYTIGFMDEDGEYSDMREFSNIKITKDTSITTDACVSDETYMYVDEDGDGEEDIVYRAETDSKAEIVDYSIYIYIGLAVLGGLVLVILVLILIRRIKIRRYL